LRELNTSQIFIKATPNN